MADYILSAFADEADKSLDGQIDALKKNGIHYLEIRSVNGVNIADTPLETVAEYKKKLDSAGISVMTVGSPIGKVGINDDFDAHMEKLAHVLRVAKILGAQRIRMFSFFTDSPDEDKEKVIERLNKMVDMADSCGIKLCHENEKDIYGDITERVKALIESFGGRMGFIFDPANYIQCGVDPKAAYSDLKDTVLYFHIKDALASTGEVVPAGKGDGAIDEILSDFASEHKNTMLTVEPHLMTFAGLKDEVSIKDTHTYVFENNREAFDAAVTALKKILENRGLSYE